MVKNNKLQAKTIYIEDLVHHVREDGQMTHKVKGKDVFIFCR